MFPFRSGGASDEDVAAERVQDRRSRELELGSWQVGGTIIAGQARDVEYKGHRHHESEEDPQYEIKSDKTDHVAMHKGSALRKRTTVR